MLSVFYLVCDFQLNSIIYSEIMLKTEFRGQILSHLAKVQYIKKSQIKFQSISTIKREKTAHSWIYYWFVIARHLVRALFVHFSQFVVAVTL